MNERKLKLLEYSFEYLEKILMASKSETESETRLKVDKIVSRLLGMTNNDFHKEIISETYNKIKGLTFEEINEVIEIFDGASSPEDEF